jgi:hypothetical protein
MAIRRETGDFVGTVNTFFDYNYAQVFHWSGCEWLSVLRPKLRFSFVLFDVFMNTVYHGIGLVVRLVLTARTSSVAENKMQR